MVPAVAAEMIRRVVRVAVLLLLGHERPLLIHLELASRGRLGHQLVVSGPGMLAGESAIAADGVGMDVDQAGRLADAAALVDVSEDREGLVLGQVGTIQRSALALGEAGPTAAAIE